MQITREELEKIEKHAKKAVKRIKKLEHALDQCLEVLARIRYTTWPAPGLGIGVCAEGLDEVLMLGEKLVPTRPRVPKKA